MAGADATVSRKEEKTQEKRDVEEFLKANQVDISKIRNDTWALSNFCCGKPQPLFDKVRYVLPALRWLINLQDDDVLVDACWALSYLSDGPYLKIQAVIEAGICPKLVELLSHPSPFVIILTLRTMGNVVTGDDVQTQAAIDNGAIPRILHLLTIQPTKKSITKEACLIISNITAGTRSQVQVVINAKIFPPLIFLLANAEFDINKEAVWAFSNATSGGNDEQIKYLASQGCIQSLCGFITCHSNKPIQLKRYSLYCQTSCPKVNGGDGSFE